MKDIKLSTYVGNPVFHCTYISTLNIKVNVAKQGINLSTINNSFYLYLN